jgi:hypothetical protein
MVLYAHQLLFEDQGETSPHPRWDTPQPFPFSPDNLAALLLLVGTVHGHVTLLPFPENPDWAQQHYRAQFAAAEILRWEDMKDQVDKLKLQCSEWLSRVFKDGQAVLEIE